MVAVVWFRRTAPRQYVSEFNGKPNKIAPKHAAILACKQADKLSDEQRCLLPQLIANCPTLALMRVLAQDFRDALFGGDSARMLDWIRNATQSGLGPLVRFGFGLKKDLPAVTAAMIHPGSSGPSRRTDQSAQSY